MALERAQKLMREYDVEEYEVNEESQTVRGVTAIRRDVDLGGLKTTILLRYHILHAIGQFFDVEVLMYTSDPRGRRLTTRVCLVGTPPDVEVVEVAYKALSEKFAEEITKKRKELVEVYGPGVPWREVRIGFYRGFEEALDQRYRKQKEGEGGRQELISLAKQVVVREEAGDATPFEERAIEVRDFQTYAESYEHGYEKGKKADLSGRRIESE